MQRCLSILALVALSTPACVGVEIPEDQEVARSEEGGQLSLEWLIVQGDELVSCIDAGATEVELAVLGASEIRLRQSCFNGFATVGELESGPHLVEVSLISPDGERMVTAELGEIEIVAGATAPLGAVELSL